MIRYVAEASLGRVNGNYVIYTYYKIRIWSISSFIFMLFESFENIVLFSNLFGHGVFCTISCCFEYRIRIRCIWLYMGTCFNLFCDLLTHFFKTCPRSVNNLRTICFDISGDLGYYGTINIVWNPTMIIVVGHTA